MQKFVYTSRDANARKVTGEVESPDINAAAKLVRSRGYFVIKIQPKKEGILSFIKRIRSRVSKNDVSILTRQLATMINAGLSITQTLSILRLQSKTSIQPIVAKILTDIESGESLSKSFAAHPKIFPPSYVALISAGEAGGVLDTILARLSDNLEKESEFRGKVKGALIYPAIIVIGMIVVGFVMMIFVVPRLLSLYSDFKAELPIATKILIGFTNLLTRAWPLLIVLGIGAVSSFISFKRTLSGRRKIDELIFKIPIIGELQRQIILTDLARTLALMVGSGVSIVEGLNISADVVGNSIISDALKDAAIQIEKGFPIAYSFAKHDEAFPYMFVQMVAVGEESGKMDEVLTKLSHVYEIESDQTVKALMSAIEPVIMIILGLGVGFLVVAMILPIYNLTTQL